MIFITEMAGALWIFQLANKCNRYLAINVKHFSHWTAHKTHWLAQNPWSSFFCQKKSYSFVTRWRYRKIMSRFSLGAGKVSLRMKVGPRILPFYIFRFGVHFQNFTYVISGLLTAEYHPVPWTEGLSTSIYSMVVITIRLTLCKPYDNHSCLNTYTQSLKCPHPPSPPPQTKVCSRVNIPT